MQQFAQGERGSLRIGMECHPCYQWLLKIVSPYLAAWPDVDVDVKQKFQFGGIGALFGYEIDMLVTPIRCSSRVCTLSPSLTMSRCWWWLRITPWPRPAMSSQVICLARC